MKKSFPSLLHAESYQKSQATQRLPHEAFEALNLRIVRLHGVCMGALTSPPAATLRSCDAGLAKTLSPVSEDSKGPIINNLVELQPRYGALGVYFGEKAKLIPNDPKRLEREVSAAAILRSQPPRCFLHSATPRRQCTTDRLTVWNEQPGYRTQLITSAMNVLSGAASIRPSGLVQLAIEAFSSVLPDNPKLQQLKEEVLMRGIRFVHTELWAEHLGLLKRRSGMILGDSSWPCTETSWNTPPVLDDSATNSPFAELLRTILDLMLFKATTSTINPLVSTITSGLSVVESLYDSRFHADGWA
ncbi:hypothetical protein C8F01DRAFT_1343592 [Mycena amicta]|nr:hypothetical protein C8F01DRAFT_1343592 [Mycena amicta]